MAELKFTKIDENGVSEKTLDELTLDERLDVELGVMLGVSHLLCATCLVAIPKGTGFFCDRHK